MVRVIQTLITSIHYPSSALPSSSLSPLSLLSLLPPLTLGTKSHQCLWAHQVHSAPPPPMMKCICWQDIREGAPDLVLTLCGGVWGGWGGAHVLVGGQGGVLHNSWNGPGALCPSTKVPPPLAPLFLVLAKRKGSKVPSYSKAIPLGEKNTFQPPKKQPKKRIG